jgi:hypothetical protein
MTFADLDTICRRRLLEKGLPLHYYIEQLFHAATCLRELNIDTLKTIRTVKLPVNSYFACDLPDDFVDDLGVSVPAGQYLQPVPKRDGITPLRLNDSTTGAFIPYSETEDDAENDTETIFGAGTVWFWNASDYGEPTGRYFGATGGAKLNGFQVFKERRQIQLTETFTSDHIILMYISDGQSADSATKVDLMAWATIDAFIGWKSSPNADIKDSYEASTYYNERRKLVARLNPLTKTDIIDVLRNSYQATIKN